jgi:hypothetical protein
MVGAGDGVVHSGVKGDDKLAQYGIEIYAAVDAYSRKIIWFYVGNSNRTQLSVLRQYLLAVEARGLCPSFIRTDKGTETITLADLITFRPGEFRIQDIISLTNWRLDKGVYLATLLFYPNLLSEKDDSDKISFHSSSVAFRDDSVIPRGCERGWREPKPPTPSLTFEPFTDLDDVPP